MYLITLLLFQICLVSGSFKFQNIQCILKEPKLLNITNCQIKAISRAQNMVNVEAQLKDTISKFKVSFQFVKRERGGWHPFLYGMSVDVCQFFEGSKRPLLPSIIYGYIKSYTDVNHTCPYMANTYVHINKVKLDEMNIIERFPLEDGHYGLQNSMYLNNVLAAYINASAILEKSYKTG